MFAAFFLATEIIMAVEITPNPKTLINQTAEETKQLLHGEKPDPTGNVLLLVDAAVKRTDDILTAAVKRIDDLRAAETRRTDDLREAERDRVNEQMHLRQEFGAKLSEAEAKRIDAIRAVDVNAVAVAAERSADQATVLASQVAASAETLRGLVATTATTTATQLQQITTQLTDRLASLEKTQYEKSGSSAVSDPLMQSAVQNLVTEMKSMREMTFQKQGAGTGQKDMVGWIVAGILFLIAVFGFMEKMQK